MLDRTMPDHEQTIKFYEDIRPHLLTQLDDEQQFDFIGLCISEFFRDKYFHMESLQRYLNHLECYATCSTFQPTSTDAQEKILLIAHRIKNICRMFLTHKEAEKAILEAFVSTACTSHELYHYIDDYLENDFDA